MIVPMKKVCLMVQESSINDTLVKLREAGVMHLCTDKKSIDTGTGNMTGMIERKKQISNAIWLLDEAKKKKTETRKTEAKNTVTEKIDSSVLLENIVNFGRERKELQSRIAFIKREITRIEKWGDFSPASVNELSNDIPVFFYEIKSNVFTMFPEDINYIKLGNGKAHSGASIQILVLEKEIPSGLIPGLLPFRLPEKSLSEFLDEVNEINIRLNSIQESLNSYVTNSDALVKEKIIVEQEIEYENAVCSMKNVELSALVSNNTEVSDISPDNSSINNSSIDDPPLIEHSFSYLTGYVPKDDMESLKKTAIREKWALSADDPEEADEKVPTKLKNNKFVSLVNPVTGFLGIVPGYREVDISAWFLIFFCIFFGMIFGDAVYGIILTVIAIVGIVKNIKKEIPQAFLLLLLLGVFNTVWGVLTCSWLSMEIEKVPQFLQDISLSYFSTAKMDETIVDQNLQIFCFALALLHLSIARFKSALLNIRSPKCLADLGNIAMLIGMFNVVLFLVVSSEARPIPFYKVSIYLLGAGFLLNFLFANYEKNLGQSILASVKDFLTVVLGIPNLFSDVMSYIRLWAVGLAGASIATTINTMAGPMLGGFLVFLGILLLVLGHGLNLILNVLSVLVHGVRLNTLEFSGHIGLGWSGTAYRPFKIKMQEEIK